MKLHIPTGLRAALLSCYAVVASLSTTVATSSLALGTLSYVLLENRAQAADVTFTGHVEGEPELILQSLTGWTATDNILIFAEGSEGDTLTYTGNLNSGVLGGMRVDVDGATLMATNDGHRFINGLKADALLDINGDFTIDLATAALTNVDQYTRNFSAGPNNITFDIAVGKTLTFRADLTGDTGYTTTITGGGTFDYHYSDTANDPGTQHAYNLAVTGGATLNFANETTTAAGTQNAHVIPSGSLTLDSGHITLLAQTTTMANAINVGATGVSSLAGASDLTLSGAVNVAAGGTLNLSNTVNKITGTLSGAGTVGVAAGSTLNITGTLTGVLTFENAGTINWTGVTFDLEAMGITGAGTHQLANLTGDTGFAALTEANLSGFITAGYLLEFNTNGELVITLDADTHTYASDADIVWNVTGTLFEPDREFVDGDALIVAGSPTITLAANVEAALVTINAGETVTLESDAAGDYKLDATVSVLGTLVLEGDRLSATSSVISTGTLELNIGDGNVINYATQLEDFKGLVQVNSGTLKYESAAAFTNTEGLGYDFAVGAGATLQFLNYTFEDEADDFTVSLTGGASAATLMTSSTTFYGQISAVNDTVLNTSELIVLSGGLAGSGNLSLIASDDAASVNVRSAMTHTGVLDVGDGITLGYGGAEADTYTNSFDRIILREGSTMSYQHSATTFKTLQLDGGTLSVYDMDLNVATVETLEVSKNSTIQHTYNNQWKFDTTTSTASDVILSLAAGGAEAISLEFVTISSFDGTLDFGRTTTAAVDNRTIRIGTIEQLNGADLVIQNLSEDIISDDFNVYGDANITFEEGVGLTADSINLAVIGMGTFTAKAALTTSAFSVENNGTSTLSQLNINEGGSIQMNSEADVSIGTLSFGATKASLIYTNSANLLNITTWDVQAATVLDVYVLDIIELLEGGTAYDLGIVGTVTEDQINIVGYEKSDYALDVSSGSWQLTLAPGAELKLDWDYRWGLDVIASAPALLTEKNDLTGIVGLFNTPDEYTVGGDTSVHLTDGGGETTIIVGGTDTDAAATAVATNTWIQVSGGTFQIIVGGNLANNWGGGAVSGFTGDSHILVDGGTVNTIIGGNYKDGQGAAFTGDSYITVKDGATITGAIIGGIAVTHSTDPIFTGDTHIFIDTVLADTSGTAIHSDTALRDAIIGGNAWLFNVNSATVHTGDSAINIDLSKSTSTETSFNRYIIGGSTASGGGGEGGASMIGDTSVSITGKEGVTFTRDIIGGHYGYVANNYLSLAGDTRIHIKGEHTVIDANIYGAHYNQSNGYNGSVSGTSYITITDATIGSDAADRIVGATAVVGAAAPGAHAQGGVEITLENATINSSVYGGYYFDKSAQPLLNNDRVTIGDIEIIVNGSTLNTDLVGGSYLSANANVMKQGNIFVDLITGEVGSVYAAGSQQGAATMVTESTAVLIGADMTFRDGSIISGGYTGAGTGSTVIGTRSLEFSSDTSYSAAELDKVDFVDFNVLYVNNADVTVTLNDTQITDLDATLVTKTGAGTLVLTAAQTGGMVAADDGTLQLGANSSLSQVTINAGRVDVTGTQLTITAALSVADANAGLTMDYGNAGIALGTSASFGRTSESAKIALTLTGLVTDEIFEQVLVSGISDFADLGNISGFVALGNGDIAIEAGDLLSSLNGVSDLTGYYIIQDGDSLVLTNNTAQNLYWIGDGTDSIWDTTELEWHSNDAGGDNAAFIERDNVFFTADGMQKDITVNSDILIGDMTVDSAAYSFSTTATGSIEVTGDLSVTGTDASLTAGVVMNLSNSNVSIAAGNSLALNVDSNYTMKSLNSEGTVDVTGNLSITEVVSSGGAVAVTGGLTLADGQNVFTTLNAATVTADSIAISDGDITNFSGTQLSITGGTVTIGTLGQALTSFTNTGTLTTTGVLSLTAATASGGTVSAAAVSLAGMENVFTQLTATADVTQAAGGILNLGGTSSIASLSGGSLVVGDDAADSTSITTTADTALVMASGAGSLSTAGNLSLSSTEAGSIGSLNVKGTFSTAAAYSAGTLTAHHLNLGGKLEVTDTLDISSQAMSIITVGHNPVAGTPVIAANSINAQSLQLSMTDAVLSSLGLTNGQQYTLATSLAANAIGGLFLNSGTETTYQIGSSQYTISEVGNDIILSLVVTGNTWEGGTTGSWGDGVNWDSNSAPSNAPAPDDREAILAGDTGATINLGAAIQSASDLRVEMSTAGTYTLTNGTLETQKVDITVGTLALKDVDMNLVEGAISTDRVITIGAQGALELDAASTLTAGALNILTDGALSNAGEITVENLSATDQTIVNTGELNIVTDAVIGSLEGAEGILRLSDDATATITTLENETLDLGAGSTLNVASDLSLSTMIGAGSLYVGNGTDDGLGLTVKENSTGITSGTVYSDVLTLSTGASASFDALNVNSVNINGALNTTDARLSADSILNSAGTEGVMLNISADTIAGMSIVGDAATSYMVYTQAGADWSLFTYSDEMKDAIIDRVIAGEDVLLTQTGNSLTLTVVESTDRTWNTANNHAVTDAEGSDLSILQPIMDVDGKIVNYSVLDTVDKVVVSQDSTIDLTGVAGGSLLVSNLTGAAGSTLSIIGDGADLDSVTLSNSTTSFAQNDINAQDVTLNVVSTEAGAGLQASHINLDGATIDATSPDASLTVKSLSNVNDADEAAEAMLKGMISVSGTGGVYTGSYEGATINAMSGASQSLKAGEGLTVTGTGGNLLITDAAGAKMDGIATTGAHLTIDLTGATAADQSLTLAGSSSVEGGSLTLVLSKDLFEAGEVQQTIGFANAGDSLTIGTDSELIITLDNPSGLLDIPTGLGSANITLAGLSAGLVVEGEITLAGGFEKLFTNVRYENGEIIADLNTSFYTENALTANGLAGYELVTDMMVSHNPQGSTAEYPDLSKVMTALDSLLGTNAAAADTLAASIAGASSVGLAMATVDDMSRQLGSIRNRTMSMGADPMAQAQGEWSVNGWVNAETSSSELTGEGTNAGYDLSNWGGTVGVEFNSSENFTFGVALSSLYGTYSSNDVDSMNGDLNTNYLSAFARVHDGRWSHTFVISGGLSDISATRTVGYAGGSYETGADTEGSSIGMLYEVAYTYALNEDSSTAWQPLLSVAFQNSQIDGYTETGSDAALEVGDQSMSYVTLGLGARVETVIGESAYNRDSVLSLRAMAKADFGDESSQADVGMVRGSAMQSIQSAERGMFALEVGAGLNIPVMENTSSIFIDASAEVRENQNSFSASAGYRFSF